MERHQQNACHHAGETRSSGVWWTKISLRLLSILLSVATIGVSAFYAKNWTIGALIMLGPPAGVAILWDLVEVLYLITHTKSDGIHPNACIIIDLILFIAVTAMSSVIAFTAATLHDSGWYFAFFQSEQGVEYLRIATGFGFMTAYVCVVHLVTIVIAWRELKKQPSSNRNGPQIIYVERGQYPPAASSETDPPPAYSKVSQPGESQKP